jgi:putative transposase
MREMGIKACYVKPFTKITLDPDFDSNLKNLLKEQFNPEKPNAIWCTDITYIHTKRGFAYLTSIMDLFSRRIIAWRLSETLEAKWVVECVLEAKELRRTTKPLILHSDRGSQYVSGSYLEALNRIMPSYSQKLVRGKMPVSNPFML